MTAPAASSLLGTQSEQTGAVYRITVGRDDLKLTETGAPINARMGINTWAALAEALEVFARSELS